MGEKGEYRSAHHLVGNITVVLAGHAFTDRRLHETRQRGEHVDRGVDLTVVELAIDVDLTLSDVASKIGDGVSNV